MGNLIQKILGRKEKRKGADASAEPSRESKELARLAFAHRVFHQYNANKTKFLVSQLSLHKKIVFDLVPFLLHIKDPPLSGCKDACHISPCGIYGYEPGPDTGQNLKQAFPGYRPPAINPMSSYDTKLPIKCLALIGSLGSIAQNSKSDFDYWLILDTTGITPYQMVNFQEKLTYIEKWAQTFAGAEVHFFPMSLKKVRINDFGGTTGESSGSAQSRLLKEEFYRTMTLVAGQTPYWWLMPPGVNDEEYDRLTRLVASSIRLDETRLLDLGNVHEISLSEFYGAAIWQINKTMGSPFKSVLKLALLEEYMFHHGSKGLLATELKTRLQSNEQDIMLLDPYILMFDRVSTYLTEQGRLDELDLLRRSLYIKAGVNLTPAELRKKELPRKKRVLRQMVQDWKWSQNRVESLNRSNKWSFKTTLKFSKQINDFIIKTYKNVTEMLNSRQEQVELAISQRDLTILGRKLFVVYSKRTNKIDPIRNVLEDAPALNGVTLQPHLDKAGRKVWVAYQELLSWEAIQQGQGAGSMLHSAVDLSEVLLWLVFNRLYDSNTSLNLNVGQGKLGSYLYVPELQTLLQHLRVFFPPIKYSEVDEAVYLHKPSIAKMFIIINLEEPERRFQPAQTGICYQNTWGELFFKGYRQSEEGLNIARNFIRKRFEFDPLAALENIKIFLPDREFKNVLAPKLKKYFGMSLVL